MINIGAPAGSVDLRSLVLFPAGDENTASTRLRLLPIVSALVPGSSKEIYDLREAFSLNPELVWFQKKITDQYVDAARAYKKRCSAIIYDCDDSGEALAYWADSRSVLEMMHVADLVVTDTPERAKWLRWTLAAGRITVIENELDYCAPGSTCLSARKIRQDGALRVLWFGNSGNIRSISNFSLIFQDTKKYKLIACGACAEDILRDLPGISVEFHEWSLNGFVEILRSCDITLLSHFGSRHDLRKSAHKMIASICYGVPAVVSRTPDYSRVANALGVNDAVYYDQVSLRRSLKWLQSPTVREEYLRKAQGPLLSRYAKGSFAHTACMALGRAFALKPTPGRLSVPEYFSEPIRSFCYATYNRLIWGRYA